MRTAGPRGLWSLLLSFFAPRLGFKSGASLFLTFDLLTSHLPLCLPRLPAPDEIVQRRLHFLKFAGSLFIVGVGADQNRRSNENGGATEGMGNLGPVPTLAEDPGTLGDNVKAENGSAASLGEQHSARRRNQLKAEVFPNLARASRV